MADLWTMQIFIAERQQPVALVFHSEGAARAAWAEICEAAREDATGAVEVTDNYGTAVRVMGADLIEGVVLQEAGKAAEAGIELSLQQARTQAKLAERVEKDPMLRAHQQRLQSKQMLGQMQAFPMMPLGRAS
jgi:hypothetical protein